MKENRRIEEGRGRTREGKGKQKALAYKLIPLCHCALGSGGSWTVADNHPACCLLHIHSGLRHQDAFVKLPCQLALVQPDFLVQALSAPIQPRYLPHKTLLFPLLRLQRKGGKRNEGKDGDRWAHIKVGQNLALPHKQYTASKPKDYSNLSFAIFHILLSFLHVCGISCFQAIWFS